jgi:hypothetical protein
MIFMVVSLFPPLVGMRSVQCCCSDAGSRSASPSLEAAASVIGGDPVAVSLMQVLCPGP